MKNNKTKMRFEGWMYEYNKTMTYCIGWPEGFKGQRVRIKKDEMQRIIDARTKSFNK